MLTRFELLVILRTQVSDRAIVRRSLAVEVGMEALAKLRGGDVATWGLAGLGGEIGAELCAANPERIGEVSEEILLTEGAPVEVAAAAAGRGPIADALRRTRAIVDEISTAGLDAFEPGNPEESAILEALRRIREDL